MEALIIAILAGVVTFVGAFIGARSQEGNFGATPLALVLATGASFVATLISVNLLLYWLHPAFTGGFWGYDDFLGFGLIIAVVCMIIGGLSALLSNGVGAGVAVSHLVVFVALILLFIVDIVGAGIDTNGDGAVHQRAKLINLVTDTSKRLPNTDPQHIVQISKDMAYYYGQLAVARCGTDCGSNYTLNKDDLTLQSINHHLYYLAPLSFRDYNTQLQKHTTPGYIKVDAENPQAASSAEFVPVQLTYLKDASWDQDVVRHAWEMGYKYGVLEDATLEVDDNGKVFWTIAYDNYLQTYNGRVIKSLLLVDAQSGTITEFPIRGDFNAAGMYEMNPADLAKIPGWVDRVVSLGDANAWMNDWGDYGDPNANWINPGGGSQKKPDGSMELVYALDSKGVDTSVWLQPYTSSNAGDTSSVGFMLMDTRSNKATFFTYPGITVGDSAKSTFTNSQNPIIRGHQIDNVQLYSIYGEPTYVATISQDQNVGTSFVGLAMVDALHMSGQNVVADTTLSGTNGSGGVLYQYQNQLALEQGSNRGTNGGGSVERITGKAVQVSSADVGGNTQYYLVVQNASKTVYFHASITVNPDVLPFVQQGDTVTITYNQSDLHQQQIMTIDDSRIDGLFPTATPTPK